MTDYEGNDRYQFQARHVKAWRWLRHRPLSMLLAAGRLLWWMLCGAKPIVDCRMTRLQTAGHIWICCKSISHFRMGWYYTTDELKAMWNL